MASRAQDLAQEYTKGLVTLDTGMLLPPGVTPDCLNVIEERNALRRAEGFVKLSTYIPAAGTPLWIGQFTDSTGTTQLIIVTTTGIFSYDFNASPTEWVEKDDFSDSSLSDYTVLEDHYVIQSKTVGGTDILILTDYVNTPREFNGTSVVNLTVPSGVKWKFMCMFFNHLVVGYVYESSTTNATRVKWSILGDPETWTGTGSGYVDLTETMGPVNGMVVFGDTLYVFKETSIYTAVHTNPPAVFYFSLLISNIGCIAPKTIVPTPIGVFFLGNNNVYLLSPGGMEPVGEPIKDLIYGANNVINLGTINKSFGQFIPSLNEYWLGVPLEGTSNPNYFLRYSISKKRWYPVNVGSEFKSIGYYTLPGMLSWTGLGSTHWDDLVGIWTGLSEPDQGDLPVFLRVDGYVFRVDESLRTFDGVYPTAYRDTQDVATAEHSRLSAFDLEASGTGPLELQISTDRGATWTSLGQVQVDSVGWETHTWWMNRTDNVVRFRIIMGDGDVVYRRMKIWLIPRTR